MGNGNDEWNNINDDSDDKGKSEGNDLIYKIIFFT